jgi:hypothetical protein
MAKSDKILKSFFEGQRRIVRLNRSELLSNRAEEKRLKLHFSMPLTGQPVRGLPRDFVGPLGLMEKPSSVLNESRIEAMCKGMTLDLYPLMTSKVRSRIVTQTGTMLVGFCLIGEGPADVRSVELKFIAYLPFSDELYQACAVYHHKTLHLEAAYSQTEMDFEGAEAAAVDASASEPVED